jgi:hypothetical protein
MTLHHSKLEYLSITNVYTVIKPFLSLILQQSKLECVYETIGEQLLIFFITVIFEKSA